MHGGNTAPVEPENQRATVLDMVPFAASFGASVRGLDFTGPVSGSVARALSQALDEHQVLLFPQQFLTEEQQIRFAEMFGNCRTMWQNAHYVADNSKVHYLSNVDRHGRLLGSHPDPDSTVWHSDGSWERQPPRATVLNAVQIPATDGDTQFASLYQLYDNLDQVSKDRYGSLQVEHDHEITRARRYRRLPWQWWRRGPGGESPMAQLAWWRRVLKARRQEGPVIHPLVRPHPETGRKTLFIGDHAWRLTDTAWLHGARFIRRLNQQDIPPTAIYTHKWQVGDLLIWDNGSLLHRVLPYDLTGQARIMRRCVVLHHKK